MFAERKPGKLHFNLCQMKLVLERIDNLTLKSILISHSVIRRSPGYSSGSAHEAEDFVEDSASAAFTPAILPTAHFVPADPNHKRVSPHLVSIRPLPPLHHGLHHRPPGRRDTHLLNPLSNPLCPQSQPQRPTCPIVTIAHPPQLSSGTLTAHPRIARLRSPQNQPNRRAQGPMER